MNNETTGSALWQELRDVAAQATIVLEQAESDMDGFQAAHYVANLEEILRRIARAFKLGVVGEFNAGKSSLINVLAEREIALVDEMETTATLNCYAHADSESAAIHYTDSRAEPHSIGEINRILDARRHDTEWLGTIDHIAYAAPSASLHGVELWDTPGLAGSEFNDRLAQRFIGEVDAVIWVFDCEYLGAGRPASALNDLRDRGKRVLAVVNKAEERSCNEFSRIAEVIQRSYPSISFACILPFSAWMAKEWINGQRDKVFFGDLPDDGGLQDLRNALEQEVLTDPQRLTGSAAMGDMLAVLSSVEDYAHERKIQVKRLLSLYETEEKRAGAQVDKELRRLEGEVSHDIKVSLRQNLDERAKARLADAELDELQDKTWLGRELSQLLDPDKIQHYCEEIFSSNEQRVSATVEEIINSRREKLRAKLLPVEQDAFDKTGRFGSDHVVSAHIGATSGGFPDTLRQVGWGALGVAIIGLVFPPLHVLTLVGVIVSAASHILAGVLGQAPDAEKIRGEAEARIMSQISEYVSSLEPYIDRWVKDQFTKITLGAKRFVMSWQEGLLFGSRSRNDLASALKASENLAEKMSALSKRLEVALPGGLIRTTNLLDAATVIRVGERDRAQELLSAVFAAAIGGLSVTDGDLDPRGLEYLFGARSEAPIRIVTWKYPSSPNLSESFAETLGGLKTRRTGAVTVITPKPFGGTDETILPQGCWIFTQSHAYHFNRSLADVITTRVETTFTPCEEADTLRETHFLRWWNGTVPNYHTVQIAGFQAHPETTE